eukprot:TRINITY_DN30142_c0_g1_i1.p1 TRINITY_DN30142_c0_g1~~TRINITY_DN30142_c0_g1_i1.p1  ORF type:complete len:245 (+),score=56.99 TRINITY_DN30142_c0_g1_i1:25-735(+)
MTGGPSGVTPQILREWADWLDSKSTVTSQPYTPQLAQQPSSPHAARQHSPSCKWTRSPRAARIDNTWKRGVSPTKGHHFLHKGHGVLVSDGVKTGEAGPSFSPKRLSPNTVRGRLGSPSIRRNNTIGGLIKADPPKDLKSLQRKRTPQRSVSKKKKKVTVPETPQMPSPLQVTSPHNISPAVPDAQLRSFDHVRGLVVKLVELQHMLEDPANADPETQHLLSNRMLSVREALAACS